jgi:hypothetical protein
MIPVLDLKSFRAASRAKRIAVLAVLAVLLGMAHWAAHVHPDGAAKEPGASTHHVCGVCTVLQAAGGPPQILLPIWPASLLAIADLRADSRRKSSPASPHYRSRAPPSLI